VTIDAAAIACAIALAGITVVLFALAPSLQLSRADPRVGLTRAAGATTLSGRGGRLRSTLIASEVAFSLVLVVGATLMLRTLAVLSAIDPGYDADQVLAVDIAQTGERYDQPVVLVSFADRLLTDVRALPGASGAALAFAPNSLWTPRVDRLDAPFPAGQEASPFASSVTHGYFTTMGIALRRGREFGPQDRPGAPVAAIVNETFGREVLGGGEPIGTRLTARGIPQMAAMEVVGVVADTKRLGLAGGVRPELYVSYAQMPVGYPTLLIRVERGDPLALARAIDERVATIDPGVPTVRARRLGDELNATIANRRTISLLLGAFATLALCLTGVGIAGVVSYLVVQRTPEIGLRMALGARPSMVSRLVVAGALMPVVAGLAIGGLAVWPFTRVIRAFLYRVAPFDPWAIGLGVAVMVVVAVAAAYLPARRATGIDPLTALRAL
jgi:putative ABC transport system permease protein